MKLRELLAGVPVLVRLRQIWRMEISGVSYDSRTARPGDLFVAMTGFATDGHAIYCQGAGKRARRRCCARRRRQRDVPYVQTEDSRRALAVVGANWFGHPAEEMTMVAVTGTNGKTTTTYLLKAILEQAAGPRWA